MPDFMGDLILFGMRKRFNRIVEIGKMLFGENAKITSVNSSMEYSFSFYYGNKEIEFPLKYLKLSDDEIRNYYKEKYD